MINDPDEKRTESEILEIRDSALARAMSGKHSTMKKASQKKKPKKRVLSSFASSKAS
jgi:hypothetical protein